MIAPARRPNSGPLARPPAIRPARLLRTIGMPMTIPKIPPKILPEPEVLLTSFCRNGVFCVLNLLCVCGWDLAPLILCPYACPAVDLYLR